MTDVHHTRGAAVRYLLLAMHLLVLAGAALLIGLVSYDTFQSLSFVGNTFYLTIQYWICLLFLFDLVVECLFAPARWRYFLSHIPAFLLCIPYLAVLHRLDIHISGEWLFLLEVLPVVRAVFVVGAVMRELRIGKLSSMFGAYLFMLLTVVYFGALMFYVAEGATNPQVHSFRSAIYWAVMSMTTTGSNITETTTIGSTIAVVISAMGLMLFPVFTVYISNAVASNSSK